MTEQPSQFATELQTAVDNQMASRQLNPAVSKEYLVELVEKLMRERDELSTKLTARVVVLDGDHRIRADAAERRAEALEAQLASLTSDEAVMRALSCMHLRSTPTGCVYLHRDDMRSALAAARGDKP